MDTRNMSYRLILKNTRFAVKMIGSCIQTDRLVRNLNAAIYLKLKFYNELHYSFNFVIADLPVSC